MGAVPTAKLAAYKGLWICFFWGVLVTTVFLIFADDIPGLLTKNPVLHQMVAKNIPVISVANMISGIGIMADQILDVQNRAVLATKIGLVVFLFVTLPLGALSSLVLDLNLEGLTASISIGAAAASALSLYATINSNWERISQDVLSIHGYSGGSSGELSSVDDYDWCELPSEKLLAAKVLGYNERLWESGEEPRSSEKDWNELSVDERRAAMTLGYNETKWNGDEQ